MKKALIIVHDVPGKGGSRFAKIVHHLPRFGYEPVVLTIRTGRYGVDAAARGEADGVRIYKTWCLRKSPFRIFSKFFHAWSLTVYLERLFFVPDLFITWLPSALRTGYRLVKTEGIDVVISTSPPESAHLVGLLLKRLTGVPWIADFQDLWTIKQIVYRPPTPLHDMIARGLERRIHDESDHIIANTRGNGHFYRTLFGIDPARVTVIPNGYDRAEALAPVRPEARGLVGERAFTVGYMGYFDKEGFPWKDFLLAVKGMNGNGSRPVKVLIAGHMSRAARRFIDGQGLAGDVAAYGEIAHAEAFQLIRRADLLVLLMYETSYSKAIVPHKLYYYLAMGKPILAVAEPGGEVADIIRATNTGRTVSAGTPGGIGRALGEYRAEWERSGSIWYAPVPREIEAYEYGRLTQRLASAMDKTIGYR